VTDPGATVLLDPSEELAAGLGRIEDLLLFSDPDTVEDQLAVDAGAAVASALGLMGIDHLNG
jgi:hypothetical protein